MKIKKLIWKDAKGQYSSGKECFLGKWKVGAYHRNGIDRDEALRHVATCKLPGIDGILGKYPTEEVAMARIEGVVERWLSEIIES